MMGRFYFGVEYLLLAMVPRDRPRGVFLLVFRIPVFLYRIGMGFLIGKGILLLATKGRKSGKRRITALGYGIEKGQEAYNVGSGWTGGADWYRNAVSEPRVQIWLGTRWIDCLAQPIPETALVGQYRELREKNPLMERIFSKWLGRPFRGTDDDFLSVARAFPGLALLPVAGKADASAKA
jgi:deazaflavin-dependent oxidoreductase (nitroreductase family)